METILSTKTAHRFNCSRVFKNYDMNCPRCRELAEGFGARKGWNSRAAQDAQRCEAIRRHFNVVGADGLTGHQRNEKTNTVDTAFEW